MTSTEVYDVVGVGIGPFNLSLAALAEPVADLRTLFLDAKPRFSWHPGLMLDGAMLQVPFLADLVTLTDPTSRWSFLSYLREHNRLFPFFILERFHVPRREYDHYCRWVAESLPCCRFGSTVDSVTWDDGQFTVEYADATTGHRLAARARNVVLGVGTQPAVPEPLRHIVGERAFHAASYLDKRDTLPEGADVTVVGSGQSGAEVFLDLLRIQPERGWRLRWLTRSPAFAPMEYSKLGLEHFTPDYLRYFRGLAGAVRDRLVPAQWQLYKGISEETIGQIYDLLYERGSCGAAPEITMMPNVAVTAADDTGDGVRLSCHHLEQDRAYSVTTDRVVLATGYAAHRPTFLGPLGALVEWDSDGRYQVDEQYRVSLDPGVTGSLYVQNAELHTHGVGAPDLTLGAWRAATILNAIAGRPVQPVPAATSFTTFGLPVPSGRRNELVARSAP